ERQGQRRPEVESRKELWRRVGRREGLFLDRSRHVILLSPVVDPNSERGARKTEVAVHLDPVGRLIRSSKLEGAWNLLEGEEAPHARPTSQFRRGDDRRQPS